MEQPLSLPAELSFKEVLQKEKDPIRRMLPGYKRSRIIWLLYEECCEKVLDEYPGLYAEDTYDYLVHLAEKCCAVGIPEEDMLKYTLTGSFFRNHEIETRITVRNIYERGKTKKRESVFNPKRVQHLKFLDFMQRRYSFRYNVLKECVEYHKYRSYYFSYVPVGLRELNGICVDAHDEGLFVWDRDVKRYLQSNRVPVFHPLEEYLNNLPEWDGKDHIRILARRIHTDREGWEEQFYKWFVYLAAQWVKTDELHANSTVPVLIGKQGYHKSTFCKMLLPPELRDYYKEQLDIRKKREVDWCLSRFALINLDEFDSIRSSDHAALKHILQKTETFEKDSVTGADIRRTRIASFIATCNSFDLLSDPTGSRRYICLELTADFDFDSFPDYRQLYAQAKDAIQRQEQYWFTSTEEAAIIEANEPYQQIPLIEELFQLYFTRAEPDEPHEVLSSTELLMRLKKLSRAGFEINQKTRLFLSKSLRKLNIIPHRTRKGSGYCVKQIKWD